MALSDRENYLRNARFQGPEYIPALIRMVGSCWNTESEEIVLRHPELFPGYTKGSRPFHDPAHSRAEQHERFTDAWGCVWERSLDGLEGVVIEPALEDWENLDDYSPPDPREWNHRRPADWSATRERIAEAKARGDLTKGVIDHGFMLMRLYYLRGFENLMMDLAVEDARLNRVIAMLDEFNGYYVRQYVDMGVDMMHLAEDLGTQSAVMISPEMFEQWIVPSYERLIRPCKEKGLLVSLHSDGWIMDYMDIFHRIGIEIINPQDLVNGVDNLAREVKGRMCIRLDIDRQSVVPFGTPGDIHDLIEEEVRKLGSPQGGLELHCGIYPPTPPENIEAVCAAIEKFRRYWNP